MNQEHQHNEQESIKKVSGKFKEWFLDYASYVILERAVPAIEDGFKPVQRRIMHSMRDLHDGRYNKVANLVGHTMQYHPHGDASIADAMVNMGQKDLLIDTQGNWGNILTGDSAAASRYIEARLSKFALDVLFNPKITTWAASYDGRKKEPVNLPAKFPIVLAQGAEGIAVGLSTTILPHNFNELIDASIKILQGKRFVIYPDFLTGGMIDISNYNDGKRGGKIRNRARITVEDNKTLVITEIPFKTTTTSLIDSIIKANNKGKIKIKKIEDNTSENVEIRLHLPPGISPDKTIDALYAFTACETSLSPLGVVIEDNKPLFLGVSEMLERSTKRTVELLKAELQIELDELENQWHAASLERIFIENRIYRDIEQETTWEGVIKAIDEGLKPHIAHLKRAVTEEDIIRLTEIKIKRISKFDIDKAKQLIDAIEEKIAEKKHHLANIIDYTIDFFKYIKKKYGKGRERKTEIKTFDDIVATKVVMRNVKLYVNREEGFVGTSLKKNEYVGDVSDIDDIIVIRKDGKLTISKVADKKFFGKDIIYVNVFKKKDKRTIYNLIYRDGSRGPSYMKRFFVSGVTRDKDYDLTSGNKASMITYFSANPNGEAEVVTVHLRQTGSLRKTKFDIDFKELAIKGRGVKGNLVTKLPVKAIKLKEAGVSTLKPRKIWFDKVVMRLNTEERGELIGEFSGDEQLVLITQDGRVAKFVPDMEKHFPENMIILEKYEKGKPITAAYFDKNKNRYFIKRFLIDDLKKEEAFIPENANLLKLSTDWLPVWELHFGKERGKKQKDPQQIDVEEFISIKGVKAQGNLLSKIKIKQVEELPSKPYKSDENIEQIDDVVEEEVENIPFEIKIPEQEEIVEEEEPKKPNNNEPPTLF
jgi:topoisomerase-4 subunit A